MHRTQILLEDAQYERLRQQSRASGTGIGELVRRAVDQVYGSITAQERLEALDATFGTAAEDDFDGLAGGDYVERERRGLDQRLRNTIGT
jgi:hypothetical protein